MKTWRILLQQAQHIAAQVSTTHEAVLHHLQRLLRTHAPLRMERIDGLQHVDIVLLIDIGNSLDFIPQRCQLSRVSDTEELPRQPRSLSNALVVLVPPLESGNRSRNTQYRQHRRIRQERHQRPTQCSEFRAKARHHALALRHRLEATLQAITQLRRQAQEVQETARHLVRRIVAHVPLELTHVSV